MISRWGCVYLSLFLLALSLVKEYEEALKKEGIPADCAFVIDGVTLNVNQKKGCLVFIED